MSHTENSAAPAALSLKNITKLYAGTVALRDVSLTVRRGEVHGLIGKNGAGHTQQRRDPAGRGTVPHAHTDRGKAPSHFHNHTGTSGH